MAVNYLYLVAFCLFSVLLINGVNSRQDKAEFQLPDICKLKPKPGMCMAYFPRWYFNTTLNRCMKFIYGGCNGNQNRFETKEECKRRCPHAKLHSTSFDEQEKQQESSTTQDDKEQHSSGDEHETQEPPCNAALRHRMKKIERMLAIEKLRASLLVGGEPMFHLKYVQKCDEEGFYAPVQCFRDTSECWCVDRMGNEIENSREKNPKGRLNCSEP